MSVNPVPEVGDEASPETAIAWLDYWAGYYARSNNHAFRTSRYKESEASQWKIARLIERLTAALADRERKLAEARAEIERWKAFNSELPPGYAVGDDATAELAVELAALRVQAVPLACGASHARPMPSEEEVGKHLRNKWREITGWEMSVTTSEELAETALSLFAPPSDQQKDG